jgi:RecB family exonuclease
MKFNLNGETVYAIPDLCYRKPDGTVVLIDWKTGKEKEDLSLQLKLYALRLGLIDKINAEELVLEGYNYFLSGGRKIGRRITVEDINEAKEQIAQSQSNMKNLLSDITANLPKSEDHFPKTESKEKCRKCVFRELCV